MARFRGSRSAFGWPGIEPRWTHGSKDGVGTAYSGDSRVWFTIWNGCLTEAYYPTIDRAQVRDLQYLVTDGKTFFHEEKHDLRSSTERVGRSGLAYRVTNEDPKRRYQIVKDVISSPHLPCVLQRTRLEGSRRTLRHLRMYALCAPHLQVGGWGNNARVLEAGGRLLLVAEKEGVWLAMGATVPFARCSVGYVGSSDGWTDLAENFQMDWEFDEALNGNVALMGELVLDDTAEFTLGLAFGLGSQAAVSALLQALSMPFAAQAIRYEEQWERPCEKMLPLDGLTGDNGRLYRSSYDLLLAHEDKIYPGAFIASMSIPWGEVHGDEDMGGYHLVWTRDMVNSATGIMAAGNTETPLRALIYLAASQGEDGGFPQNFWINGIPYWGGIQLDEVAFPIMLAWRLHEAGALGDFDPYPMVLRGAGYLVEHGPATQQERWEEISGYSPSTLASNIAALICAAQFARLRGETATAEFLEDYADFLESRIEEWTATQDGTLLPGVARHYIRILPADVADPRPEENPDHGVVALKNRPPGAQIYYPAKEIVDAGFLELVRYGIKAPDDPLIMDSVKVVDAVLKVDTPVGLCWRRYNHDGYGQREDGGPFEGWGRGRAWPLLTGERAHYELSLGRDVGPLMAAMEGFASPTGLLPEQVWDAKALPRLHMHLGKPTGSAMPLMWAHAEYIKLLRSVRDGEVFDRVKAVAQRYLGGAYKRSDLEVWKANRQPARVRRGTTLRIQASSRFQLVYTLNDWQTHKSKEATMTAVGVAFVDVHIGHRQRLPIRFTMFWPERNSWQGQDYVCDVVR